MSVVYLQGTKVILRDLIEADIRQVYHWIYEADDREHLNWNGPYYKPEPTTYQQFRESWQWRLNQVAGDITRSMLVIEVDGELRGTVSRYWVDEVTNWMETGIVIFDSRYWSGGYGTQAFDMWIDYLFGHLDVVRLGISTWSGNERMIKLAQRLGMIEEARVRKARIVNDAYYDSIKMGILREEWQVRKGLISVASKK